MKKSTTILCFAMTFGVFITGCASQPAAAPQETAVQKQTEPVGKTREPGWLTNPDFEGRFGAVGYAKPGKTPYMQRQTALIVAKARLSERMGVQIQSLSVSQLTNEDGELSSSYRNRIVQTSDHKINRVTFRDEYRDESGVLYLWLTNEKDEK